jgi:hypothetical protein
LIIQFTCQDHETSSDFNCSVGNVLCIAQKKYAPFTKKRREIVTMQKNDRLGFILFEKAFSSGLRGRRRTYLTIVKMAWSANFKAL